MQVKRFDGNNLGKEERAVKASVDLQLQDEAYTLRCVVQHIGKTRAAGHYVACVRRGETDVWVKYNDTRVEIVSQDSVLGEKEYRKGYIYFYEKM